MRYCLPKVILLLMALAWGSGVWAQTVVKGRVTSGDSAVTNVTVAVKGTTRATQTDQNGQFSLDAGGDAVLVFTRVGFATQELPLGGRKYLDIHLLVSSKEMNEVIVVGYGTQKKADVTGSVASVPKSRLSELPVTTRLPSGLKAAPVTQPACPKREMSTLPVVASQTLAALSLLAVTKRLPSGLKSTWTDLS